MSERKVIELDYGTVELRKDGILTFKPCTDHGSLTMADLEDVLRVFLEITDGKPVPFYCDNTQMRDLGFAERKFIGDNLHLFATASAVRENSPLIRFIGHTINQLFTPKVPMEMFNNENEAFAWLRSHG